MIIICIHSLPSHNNLQKNLVWYGKNFNFPHGSPIPYYTDCCCYVVYGQTSHYMVTWAKRKRKNFLNFMNIEVTWSGIIIIFIALIFFGNYRRLSICRKLLGVQYGKRDSNFSQGVKESRTIYFLFLGWNWK